MTSLDALSILKKILSDVSMIPQGEISAESDIFADLDVDSMALVEAFVAIELKLGVRLNPAAFSRKDINTPAKLMKLVESKRSTSL